MRPFPDKIPVVVSPQQVEKWDSGQGRFAQNHPMIGCVGEENPRNTRNASRAQPMDGAKDSRLPPKHVVRFRNARELHREPGTGMRFGKDQADDLADGTWSPG